MKDQGDKQNKRSRYFESLKEEHGELNNQVIETEEVEIKNS